MKGSAQNPIDPDKLAAYKELRQVVTTADKIVPANNQTDLVRWFVGHAKAANITEGVVTALFLELFDCGAIVPVGSGFTFLQAKLDDTRYAARAATEREEHLAPLSWVSEVLAKRVEPS